MQKQNDFRLSRSLIFAITIAAASFTSILAANDTVGAKSVSERTISNVAADLTKKLRADLADNSVTVKVNDIEKYQLGEKAIAIKGSGICVLTADNNQLPIRFEAKINPQSHAVADIKYNFVQFETSAYVSTTEEVLMKELMKKISADYKTSEIVISIDSFDAAQKADNKEFTGNGEIRIGEVEWRKIKFDVVLNADNQAAQIKYDVQK